MVEFFDVTELATTAGCDFDVWFNRVLWDWCHLSAPNNGLWSKAGGLLCSLSCIAEDNLRIGGPVQLKTAGEKVVVDLAPWPKHSDSRITLVSLCETGQSGTTANCIAASIPPHQPEAKGGSIPFYFVCELCDAKWFAETRTAHCPRCRTRNSSRERLIPPWRKHS
jgi:hypothetical protein